MSLKNESNKAFDADYEIGGEWGDRITWKVNPSSTEKGATAEVWGHKKTIPVFGQTLLAEDKKASILFQFQDVTMNKNPTDMFSATVVQIDYKTKLQP